MNISEPRDYFEGLQARIVGELEALDGQPVPPRRMDAPEGGGGIARVIEDGNVFERGGVNFSHVAGAEAAGLGYRSAPRPCESRVGGDRRLAGAPSAQSVRADGAHERPFLRGATRPQGRDDDDRWWFGGGMDLTPYYGFAEDAVHFPSHLPRRAASFGDEVHAKYKRWCDEYFYLRHRKEPRGVGGIFFDDLCEGGFDRCFALVRSVGDSFLDAYVPIVARRRETPYAERERDFQAYRRGRYVEFNLVWDRGTLFGLQSNGRTEAILMSLPPIVKWRYDWAPAPGTPEAKLYSDFLVAKDWLE
jgi:coproporphyrinogen III oxidase